MQQVQVALQNLRGCAHDALHPLILMDKDVPVPPMIKVIGDAVEASSYPPRDYRYELELLLLDIQIPSLCLIPLKNENRFFLRQSVFLKLHLQPYFNHETLLTLSFES